MDEKKKGPLIVGIISGVVIVAAIAIAILYFSGVIGNKSRNGTYVGTVSLYGYDVEVTLKIEDKDGELRLHYPDDPDSKDYVQSFKVTWDGDTLKMDAGGNILKAKYNDSNKTLSIAGSDFLGADIVVGKK
ncbi:MAG: hypothetical protein K5750_02710 [Eubacterium sp.]|nr:hypothetical protein [Eubacterium sp.]